MKNRILYIDIAKAMCIVLVVIGHYVPNGCPRWWMAIHDWIYTFHMPLFMFASGFVYMATKREESYRSFIWKKVKRLMVPYLTVSALVIALKLATESSMYVENPKTAISFVKMFYLPEAGYFLWFMWALWWMFVIVPLFKSRKQRLVLFAVAVLLHYVPFPSTEVFCISEFKRMLVYFMLGVMMVEWKSLLMPLKRVPEMAYIVTFIAVSVIGLLPIGGGQIVDMQ